MRALVDQVLADAPEPAAAHPHDRTVSLRMQRRAGSTDPRDTHCLCPVRPGPERAWDAHSGR